MSQEIEGHPADTMTAKRGLLSSFEHRKPGLSLNGMNFVETEIALR
jgi:hypothetical protein